MAQNSFYRWLSESLGAEDTVPIPETGLTHEEHALATQLIKSFAQNCQYRLYAKSYMKALQGSENLCEGAINTFSAINRITVLMEKKDQRIGLESMCQEVIKIVSDELDMGNCSIMLQEKEGDYLKLIAGQGKEDRYSTTLKERTARRVKSGEGISGTVFSTGEHIFIPDVSTDSRFKNSGKDDVSIVSLLVAPIWNNDVVIGVMNFSHPQRSGVFDRNSINFMLMLANFVGQILTLSSQQEQLEQWNILLQKEVKEKTYALVKQNRRLERIAVTDPLTSTYNRRFFFTRLKEEFNLFIRYQETFSLLMIDLDNLKGINDTYGHDMGDKVIKRIARSFKIIGRKGDVIGRVGGDEFSYIFLKGAEEEALAFAKRIKKMVAEIQIKDFGLKLTLSIGVATVQNSNFKSHLDLYRAADAAVYEAKKQRNTAFAFSQVKDKPDIE